MNKSIIKRFDHMKSLLPLSAVLAACVLSLAACNKPAAPQRHQMPTPEVAVIKAKAQAVPLSRELVGRLASTRIAQVRARVAGIILKRVYTEGTDVKKGQVLFQIDPAPLQAALHAEEAALAKAKADAANASSTATRYKDLDKKGLISSQDLDTALANERTTLAAVKQAQANVETARLNLSYATVTAPIDGRAGRALVTEGALVGQGETTELTTVEQIDPIYVNFSQSVAQLQQLQGIGPMAEGVDNQKTRVEVLLPDDTV
jgi:membrane fusion protein (multidrug efflux system)